MAFDIDSTGVYNGSYFGFEFTSTDSALSLLSVEWDATVSYREGTSKAPNAIIEASTQVEIHDEHFADQWQRGIFTIPLDAEIKKVNAEARSAARKVISHIEKGGSEHDEEVLADISFVNDCSNWLNTYVYEHSKKEIKEGRLVGLVGGDHSTPLGLIQALAEKYEEFGILHIDAHMDLRDGYEGFDYSHASIMRRALECKEICCLTQVGVRDFSKTEANFANKSSKIHPFTANALYEACAEGSSWAEQCDRIIATLPQEVYISFDIDGLEQSFCPSTGTPVPGGLSYLQAVYLIAAVARSGRRVIGFDLCEVTPNEADEWDAIVGARILYKLCNLTLSSSPTAKPITNI